jgi:hypothetical protein
VNARAIYNEIVQLGLEIRAGVTIEEIESAYNGVGAAWMPDGVRGWLTRMSADLRPAVMCHDVDYSFGDGTTADFLAANARFRRNGRICADKKNPWYSLRRYVVRRQVSVYAQILDAFGWPAYVAAVNEMKKIKKDKRK